MTSAQDALRARAHRPPDEQAGGRGESRGPWAGLAGPERSFMALRPRQANYPPPAT